MTCRFAINQALVQGLRGLPGGDTLPRLLVRKVGARNWASGPRLSVEQVLRWADAHFAQTGQWPKSKSGPITQVPGETWTAVDDALRVGLRGLPGGDSLARLLGRERGLRTRALLPRLTVALILAWADAHHEHTGRWPRQTAGPVVGVPGETWNAVGLALRHGRRGLPGGDSLSRLLARHGRGGV